MSSNDVMTVMDADDLVLESGFATAIVDSGTSRPGSAATDGIQLPGAAVEEPSPVSSPESNNATLPHVTSSTKLLVRSLSTPRLHQEHVLFTERTMRDAADEEAAEEAKRLRAQLNRRGSVYRAPTELRNIDKDHLFSTAELMQRKMRTEIDALTAFTEVPLELVDDPMGVLHTRAQKVDAKQCLLDVVLLLCRINLYSLAVSALLIGILVYKKVFVFELTRGSGYTRTMNTDDILKMFDTAFMTAAIAISLCIMCVAMFGWGRTKPLFVYWVPLCLIMHVIAWLIPLGLETEAGLEFGALRPVPAFLLTLFSAYVVSHYMEKYQFIPQFRRKFFSSMLAIFIVVVVYFYIIPELWFSTTNDMFRVALRVFLHPLLFETAAYITRASIRNLRGNHPSTTFVMTIYVMAFSAFYGRFLVSASSSSTWTLITAVILSAEEIFLRLSIGARDKLLYGLRHTPEEVRARFHTIRSVRLRADLLYVDVFLENSAIIASSMTVWIFNVGGITFERAMQDMGLQLGLEFFTDCFVLYIESRTMNIPVYEAWVTRMAVFKKKWERRLFWFLPLTYIICVAFAYFLTAYFDPSIGFLSRQTA